MGRRIGRPCLYLRDECMGEKNQIVPLHSDRGGYIPFEQKNLHDYYYVNVDEHLS